MGPISVKPLVFRGDGIGAEVGAAKGTDIFMFWIHDTVFLPEK